MVRPPPPAARPASGFSGFHFQTCWKIRCQKGLWNLSQWCNHPSIHKSISRLDLFDFMMSCIHMGSCFSTYGMGGSNGMGERLHSTESLMDGVRKLNDQAQPRTPTRAARSLETCLKSKCPMKHARAIRFLPSLKKLVYIPWGAPYWHDSCGQVGDYCNCGLFTKPVNHWNVARSFNQSSHALGENEEPDDEAGLFSPETRALLKGLGDSPESLQLKAEILGAANELRRGDLFHQKEFHSLFQHVPWLS